MLIVDCTPNVLLTFSVVVSLIGVAVLAPAAGPLELPAQLALLLEQSQTDLGTFTRSITAMMPEVDWDWTRLETE